MKTSDLVTIVVPAYNAEAFLQENIESILGQTYKNLEVIYVCDGCTDSTVDILKRYSYDDRLIIHVEEDNHGAAVSRNIGMNIANGDWIIFFDADDLFESDMIEQMVNCAYEADADMCCCYWECFDDSPRQDVRDFYNERILRYCNTYPVIETSEESAHILQLVGTNCWNKLVNKSVYKKEEVYFQDIKNSNDVYYSIIAAINTKRIVYIDKALLHYRSNKGRKTLSSDRLGREIYLLEACDKVYEYIAKENNEFLLKSFYNEIIFYIIIHLGKPVYSYIVNSLKNLYFEKWKMIDPYSIDDQLNYVYRCVYKSILNDKTEINMDEIIMQAKLEFVRELSTSGCSIWGAGMFGSRLLEEISLADIDIQHVYDSSEDKIGEKICGYTIERYEQTEEKNIIITTPKYYDVIKNTIKNYVDNIFNLEMQIWNIP